MNRRIRKMDMSDIEFVYVHEEKILGSSLGKQTLYHEILHNPFSKYFIALENGKRIGYVGSWITGEKAEILNLMVLEEYRRLQVGTDLMNTVFKLCEEKGVKQLSLEVRESNKTAISFYEILGFNISHKRKKYYKTEDALLMIKEW
jgi:ribosomal-protein-alanine N-acetyltransferase